MVLKSVKIFNFNRKMSWVKAPAAKGSKAVPNPFGTKERAIKGNGGGTTELPASAIGWVTSKTTTGSD
jgi:hypothetical protein